MSEGPPPGSHCGYVVRNGKPVAIIHRDPCPEHREGVLTDIRTLRIITEKDLPKEHHA